MLSDLLECRLKALSPFGISLLILLIPGFARSMVLNQPYTPVPVVANCFMQPGLQKIRSKELSDLVTADQKSREQFDKLTREEMTQVQIDDTTRRKRVGEIMGEGCIKTAKDYAAASLIYQHGDVPDHYYQAFIWANRAVVLGDARQKNLVAITIDRYLLSIGKKQLFGSQFKASDKTGWCTCIEPVELSFTDADRTRYDQIKLSEQYQFMVMLNKGKKNCHSTECPGKLAPTLRGSVPGFW